MKNSFAFIACILLATAVLLGAWNAHGMENLVDSGKISAKYLKTFHTGVEYQFYSALGLLVLALQPVVNKLKWAMRSIFAGTLIFSVSIYILSFHEIIGNGFRFLGAITPIGGLLMALGWILAAISWMKKDG